MTMGNIFFKVLPNRVHVSYRRSGEKHKLFHRCTKLQSYKLLCQRYLRPSWFSGPTILALAPSGSTYVPNQNMSLGAFAPSALKRSAPLATADIDEFITCLQQLPEAAQLSLASLARSPGERFCHVRNQFHQRHQPRAAAAPRTHTHTHTQLNRWDGKIIYTS
jgi:hypothetical protein